MNYTPGENLLITVQLNGASSFIRLNGDTGRQSTFTASGSNAASATIFRLGATNDSNTSFLDGDVPEGLIYLTALSSGDVTQAETYLKNRYGIA